MAAAEDVRPEDRHAPSVEVPRPDMFQLAGLRVAEVADLERPLTDRVIDLMPLHRRDIEYHRPTRVGDVLFNWFD